MTEKTRYAGRCPCGAELVIEEEYSFFPSNAQHIFQEWQRDHNWCRRDINRLRQLEIKRLEAGR